MPEDQALPAFIDFRAVAFRDRKALVSWPAFFMRSDSICSILSASFDALPGQQGRSFNVGFFLK